MREGCTVPRSSRGNSSTHTHHPAPPSPAAARADTAAARGKLASLQAASGAGALVTPAQRAKVKASLERYRGAWKVRKGMVEDLVNAMSEGLNKKPKELLATIGIETDADAGVSLKDFMGGGAK